MPLSRYVSPFHLSSTCDPARLDESRTDSIANSFSSISESIGESLRAPSGFKEVKVEVLTFLDVAEVLAFFRRILYIRYSRYSRISLHYKIFVLNYMHIYFITVLQICIAIVFQELFYICTIVFSSNRVIWHYKVTL